MESGTTSRRAWLKKAGLLTTGIGSLTVGTTAFAHPAETLAHSEGAASIEEEYVRLFYNENPYGPPASALAKVMEVANRGNRYATFAKYDFNDLRAQIAKEEGVSEEHILLGHGSFQPIIWLAQHFMRDGGEMVVPSPTFDIVGMYARRLRAKVKAVEVDERMEMNLPEMEKAVGDQTTLVCVCHPNNPTGTLVNPGRLRDFCDTVSNQCPVLVDEAYIQYTDAVDDWRQASMVDRVKAGKNVIISRTFSKIYGMAGLRIGYLIGPPELIKSLTDRFTLGFPGNMPNTLSVAAAIGALSDEYFLASSKRKNAEEKNTFYQQLEQFGLSHVPTHANFVYFKVPNFPVFKKVMNENKILLAGGWPTQPNWARVTMGKPEELAVFYEVLKREEWR